MRVLHLSAEADADGIARLTIPNCKAGDKFEVIVVMNRVLNYATDERGWPVGYFEQTAGSIDDESFVAPPRPKAEPVETVR